jgi:hypothetical protein
MRGQTREPASGQRPDPIFGLALGADVSTGVRLKPDPTASYVRVTSHAPTATTAIPTTRVPVIAICCTPSSP